MVGPEQMILVDLAALLAAPAKVALPLLTKASRSAEPIVCFAHLPRKHVIWALRTTQLDELFDDVIYNEKFLRLSSDYLRRLRGATKVTHPDDWQQLGQPEGLSDWLHYMKGIDVNAPKEKEEASRFR